METLSPSTSHFKELDILNALSALDMQTSAAWPETIEQEFEKIRLSGGVSHLQDIITQASN